MVSLAASLLESSVSRVVTDGMQCKKCTGKVFVDRIFSEKRHLELFCIMCGKRWMLDKEKSRFAAWLLNQEIAHANAAAVSL